MSFEMGKQVLDPSSMPTSTSKYFHMWSREKTLLLWIIVELHLASCKEICFKKELKLHLEYFGTFFGLLHGPIALAICDPKTMCTTATSSTKAIKSPRCSYSTCLFIAPTKNKVLYAIMPFFPFVLFLIKNHVSTWGKQMLHLNY